MGGAGADAPPAMRDLLDGMSVIEYARRPRPRVCKETDLRRGFYVILLSSLRDLGPVLLKQARRAMRRPDDRNMPRPMWVGTLEDDYHQDSTVRQRLRIAGVPDRLPSTLLARWGTKPLRLCICQQNLPVFWWPQHVYSESLPDRGGERAAMRRSAGSRVILCFVRLACLPVYVLMCEPQRLDIRGIQHR